MAETKFDWTQTIHYPLCIRISTEHFTYALYNASKDPAFYYLNYPTDYKISLTANLRSIAQECECTHHTFQQTQILLANVPFCIIPTEIFKTELSECLFHGCMPEENNQTILHLNLPKCNVEMLYGIDKTFYQQLQELYPDAHIYPAAYPIMEYLHERSLLNERKKIYVYIHERKMDIYVFENGQFLLYNTFHYTQNDDAMYYILYIWKQLGLDQEKDELYFIGNILHKEYMQENLHRFIKQISFIYPTAEFKRAEYTKIDLEFDLQTNLYQFI